MRRLVMALALAVAAVPSQAQNIFDQFGGTWAPMFSSAMTCTGNPMTIVFAPDRQSAMIEWQKDVLFHNGRQERVAQYRVFGAEGDRITMALAGETRLTANGDTVVWILRLVQDGRAHCWGRTDWPHEQCINVFFRCPGPFPNS